MHRPTPASAYLADRIGSDLTVELFAGHRTTVRQPRAARVLAYSVTGSLYKAQWLGFYNWPTSDPFGTSGMSVH